MTFLPGALETICTVLILAACGFGLGVLALWLMHRDFFSGDR